jgi:asparagine synthase (glutamine-hydrolysing)
VSKGHQFKTNCDVEVILHLYEECKEGLLDKLNGQFGFALFDLKTNNLLCARDHFGVIPFHYTVVNNFLVFASEIKSILEYPEVKREVDLIGLDQVFSFPGLISPRTMFKGIKSLENGHYLSFKDGELVDREYWDLKYPDEDESSYNKKTESEYVEEFRQLLHTSIKIRLRSDVPVGVYLSGGLDSSLIASKAKQIDPQKVKASYSICFNEKDISEQKYQKLVADSLKLIHTEKVFLYSDIADRLHDVVYHCECPIKESYNTASLSLSSLVRGQNYRVILSGEGADEFFAGYVGYKFDKMRQLQPISEGENQKDENEMRKHVWGDSNFFYEKYEYAFREVKRSLYSKKINDNYAEVDCHNHFVVNKDRLNNKHILHKRSYVDYKLRLVDHLVSDHGDRMALANSVEVRYPFLDKTIAEFAARVPPDLKLNDFDEKYIVKKVAHGLLPKEIINREKFGFVAPGSPYILKRNIEFINDLLSYETIKRQGYFDPNQVEKLKKDYMAEGFDLNIPFDSDLLIILITFGIFLEKFNMPSY